MQSGAIEGCSPVRKRTGCRCLKSLPDARGDGSQGGWAYSSADPWEKFDSQELILVIRMGYAGETQAADRSLRSQGMIRPRAGLTDLQEALEVEYLGTSLTQDPSFMPHA